MYAIVTRRRINQPRMQETLDLARSEYFPTMTQIPGFVSFTMLQDNDGVSTTIVLFESREHAAGARAASDAWTRKLDEHGHEFESQTAGEVLEHIAAAT